MGDLLNTCNLAESDEHLAKLELFKEYSEELLVFAVSCCVIYILVGISGNLVTIIALARCKKIHNATTVFIMNLACSDMLFCCYNLPMISLTYWRRSWVFGVTACQLLPMAGYGLAAVSLLTILAIMVNRYVLIAYPRQYSKIYKARYVAIMIATTWIFPFGALIPTWFGKWGHFGMDPAIESCSILPDCNRKSPKKFLIVGVFLIPCLLVLVCYLRILCIVRNSAKRCSTVPSQGLIQKRNHSIVVDDIIVKQKSTDLQIEDTRPINNLCTIPPSQEHETSVSTDISLAEDNVITSKNKEVYTRCENVTFKQLRQSFALFKQSGQSHKAMRYSTKDKKVLQMVMTIIVSSWICYLPITFIKLFRDFSVPPVPRVLGFVLVYLTTCINPIIYVVMSNEYRQAYNSILCNSCIRGFKKGERRV